MFDLSTVSPDGWYICFYHIKDRYDQNPPVNVYIYSIKKSEARVKKGFTKWKSFILESPD